VVELVLSFEDVILGLFGIRLLLQVADYAEFGLMGRLPGLASPLYLLNRSFDCFHGLLWKFNVIQSLGISTWSAAQSSLSCSRSSFGIGPAICSSLTMGEPSFAIEADGLLGLLDRMVPLEGEEARVILHDVKELNQVGPAIAVLRTTLKEVDIHAQV